MAEYIFPARPVSPATATTVPAGQRVQANAPKMMGDTLVQMESDMATRVVVGAQRGIDAGLHYSGSPEYPRRISMVDPRVYTPANPYQSIMDAIALIQQDWGGAGQGSRFFGEVEIPPGPHQLSAAIEINGGQNISLIGSGMCLDDVTGWAGGHGMTTLIAPNSAGAWCIRLTASSFANQAGPRIENLTLLNGGGSGGGGIYVQRTSNGFFQRVAAFGFTSGIGWHFDGSAGDCQYHTLVDCRAFNSATGMYFQAADGDLISCKFSGNQSGSQNIQLGSIGLRTDVGAVASHGTKIQGFDTLLQADNDHTCSHHGLYLEDFYSYGIHVVGALGAGSNTGFYAHLNSINNALGMGRAGQPSSAANGGAGDRAIWIAHTNARHVKIETRHLFATNGASYNNAGVMTAIPFRTAGYVGPGQHWVDWCPA
jgi:hypothetical protein